MGFLSEPDKSSNASRQFYIETGQYLTYGETLAEGLPVFTVGPVDKASQLAALLYDDVEVLAQYETGDRICVVWKRPSDFRRQYQIERLWSGLWPSYNTEEGLVWLIEEFFDE